MAERSDQETSRLSALQDYHILDTPAEAEFDDIVALASEICGTPISLISLIDSRRQWFKARRGLEATETPREQAFCAHAIAQPNQLMIVDDPANDPRFKDNPLVIGDPKIRFYAGAPLVNAEGHAFGTLCVIDRSPHTLSDQQQTALKTLAKQVVAQMELRKKVRDLEQANADLNEHASVVSHDLRSPLNNLESIVNLFKQDYENRLDGKGSRLLAMAGQQISNLKSLITGILDYSRHDQGDTPRSWVDLNQLLSSMAGELGADASVVIELQDHYPTLLINETVVRQIFQNLLTNAIKYNDSDRVLIEITARQVTTTHWEFTIADNGRGIPEKLIPKLFKPFKTQQTEDRFGQKGTGLGLATVKKLVERSGSSIRVESTVGQGTRFTFSLVGETK